MIQHLYERNANDHEISSALRELRQIQSNWGLS